MNSKAERRKFKRWAVSIPCSLESDDLIQDATIDNLYFGGARLVDISLAPVDGSRVTVQFRFHDKAWRQEITLGNYK